MKKNEIRKFRDKAYYYCERCMAYLSGMALAKTKLEVIELCKEFNKWYDLFLQRVVENIYFNELIEKED